MGLIRWIIALPFIVGAVLFALAHPEKISITLNPLSPPIELPLYFVALLFLGFGFLLGVMLAWLGMGQTRKERRAYKKEVKTLTKENEKLKKQSEELEEEIQKQVTSQNTDIIDVNHA